MGFDVITLAMIKSNTKIATDEDTMYFLSEIGMITPVVNSNCEVFISSSNEIYYL